MWFLYLDESGDLGFDFVNKKPSRYFTVTILAVGSHSNNRAILKAVTKTLKRKLNKKRCKRVVYELKGSETNFKVKEYFSNPVIMGLL
jgi:hypothetical protein